MSATETTPLTPVPVSLPPAQLKFLESDGTVSTAWRSFLQQLYRRTGAGTDQVATGQNSLAAAVTTSTAGLAGAIADAAEALDASDLGQLLGLVDLAPGSVTGSLTLGDLLAIQGLDESAGGGSPPTPPPTPSTGGLLPLVNGTTPFLGFVHTPDGQTIGCPV